MKIEIKEPGTYNYYDEYLYIVNNHKKIYTNNNNKISKISYSAYFYLLISSIIFITFLIWYLNTKDIIQLYIVILFAILIVLSIIYLILIKNRINKMINTYTKTNLEITKDSVIVESKNIKYEIKFKDMKKIIIGKNTISFIPNNIEELFITTRIEYKDKIISTLKQYKKEKLIKGE